MKTLLFAVTGADESAPHCMEVLRTRCLDRAESDLSDFHELSRGFIPRRTNAIEYV